MNRLTLPCFRSPMTGLMAAATAIIFAHSGYGRPGVSVSRNAQTRETIAIPSLRANQVRAPAAGLTSISLKMGVRSWGRIGGFG